MFVQWFGSLNLLNRVVIYILHIFGWAARKKAVLPVSTVSDDVPIENDSPVMLRLAMGKELPPSHGTVLGWQVPDIESAVRDLVRAGVRLERYEFLKQDELGIWTSPPGARVAWFKDPDGNVLSVSEHPEAKD